jgi:hypothetical protein
MEIAVLAGAELKPSVGIYTYNGNPSLIFTALMQNRKRTMMTMSDLIRRQDALQAIIGITTCENAEGIEIHCDASVADSEGWLGGVRDALRAIENLPSAEPERTKGEWIKHENPTLGQCLKIVYECSVCHKGVGCEYFVRRSFCPNCGADMRGDR